VTALIFLSIALVVSIVGSLALWLRNRQPTTWDSGISDFAREMKALEPREEGSNQRSVAPPRGYHADDDEGASAPVDHDGASGAADDTSDSDDGASASGDHPDGQSLERR
jgi:hypothetical protein